ncbi:DUF1627 domain-containing protein [Escherichia coli]|nr:DUF1627 domain-containing protein [Escherichia coli]
MANAWLRLWHDMPNDPKWRTIARVSGQPIATVMAVYIHLLVSASRNVTTCHGVSLRGHIDVTTEDLASALDVTEEVIDSILQAMQGRVLDGDLITGWEKRQVLKEDNGNVSQTAKSPAERKRAQREREKLRKQNEGCHDESRITEERPVKSEAQDMLTGEVEQKVTADMMIEFIGQDGAKTCEELAGKFGVSTRKVASTLAVVTATGRLARVNQNGKFRYCMPGDNLPAEPKAALVTESDGKAFPQPAGAALPVREAATQEEIKTETVADIVQPLPSFTETQADELIFPSLRRANLALRRAKSDVQKWERVCAALRELNKHRDIVRQITDSSRRVVSEK